MSGKNKLNENIFARHPKKTIIILLIITTLGIAIIGEKLLEQKFNLRSVGIIRYINLREHNPLLVDFINPTEEYMKLSDTLKKRPYILRIDDNGFIIPSKIYERADINIVFLGGSTTECVFNEEEQRWPYLVGRLLEKETGLKINSYNSARGGNNTLHSINILLNKLIPMKPKVVVLMENINDLSTLLFENTYWNNISYRAPIISINQSVGKNLERTVRLIRDQYFPYLYRSMRDFFQNKEEAKRSQDEFQHMRGKKLEIDHANFLSEFGANLQIFINICRAKNIIPVLMTQANRLTDNPDPVIQESLEGFERSQGINYRDFKSIYDLFNQQIRESGAANNVLVIDLAAKVPPTREYLYDFVHLSNLGCEYAAKKITEEIKSLF